jgi:hypothetical protein
MFLYRCPIRFSQGHVFFSDSMFQREQQVHYLWYFFASLSWYFEWYCHVYALPLSWISKPFLVPGDGKLRVPLCAACASCGTILVQLPTLSTFVYLAILDCLCESALWIGQVCRRGDVILIARLAPTLARTLSISDLSPVPWPTFSATDIPSYTCTDHAWWRTLLPMPYPYFAACKLRTCTLLGLLSRQSAPKSKMLRLYGYVRRGITHLSRRCPMQSRVQGRSLYCSRLCCWALCYVP